MAILSTAERNRLISKYVTSASGRAYLAKELLNPLRKYRDYVSIGRRAFVVDKLVEGVIPEYDLDPNVTAHLIADESGEMRSIFKGEKVIADLFTLASSPDISITDMKRRNYDVETRVKKKSESEIFRKEDRLIFGAFDKICNNASGTYQNINNVVNEAVVSVDDFSFQIAEIERHGDIRCANIFMNPANMKIVRRMGKDYFDPVTNNEIQRTGQVGALFGVTVNLSVVIPTDTIYFTGEPEFLGIIPEAYDLTVLPADTPKELKVGFSIFEQIGILINNENAVSKLTITN